MRLFVAAELTAASKSTNVDVNGEWKFFKNVVLHSITQHIPRGEDNTWKKKATWRYPIDKNHKTLINKKTSSLD